MTRFSEYLKQAFDFSSSETEKILKAMMQPLKKSIRINTQKISLADFKIHAQDQGWTLTETDIPEVFLIDRDDTTLALGRTLEHAAGWFYIQEVAAAHPPHLLREQIMKNEQGTMKNERSFLNNSLHGTLNIEHGTFLDMCAAPGGKTTQLADYFPDSLIIANEVNRTRTPQLFENLDRMGYANIAVVSCDGRFFQNFPDFFDAVLLDAPCSGEGTAFRDSSVIEHWNEKNIHRIAKLQKQLIETAETIVKPGGYMSYSTCTLNTIENENVINSLLGDETLKSDHQRQKITHGTLNIEHGTFGKLEGKYCKRFWPHIEHTGGFFASIFQKISTPSEHEEYPVLAAQGQKHLIATPATKGEREIVERFVSKHLGTKLQNGFLYLSKDGVYFNTRNLGPLAQHFYFVHAGARIGSIKGNIFTPSIHLWWYIRDTSGMADMTITPAQWSDIQDHKKVIFDQEDGVYLLRYGRGIVGIVRIEKNILKVF